VTNKPLLYSLLVSASAVLALASGLLPDVMTQFQLVHFDVDVRSLLLSLAYNSTTQLNTLTSMPQREAVLFECVV